MIITTMQDTSQDQISFEKDQVLKLQDQEDIKTQACDFMKRNSKLIALAAALELAVIIYLACKIRQIRKHQHKILPGFSGLTVSTSK